MSARDIKIRNILVLITVDLYFGNEHKFGGINSNSNNRWLNGILLVTTKVTKYFRCVINFFFFLRV